MKKAFFYFSFLTVLCLSACKKETENEIDTEYPTIDVTAASAFPKQCGEVSRGETFTFRALLGDNTALGSLSLDIHHNFDHHTHSTEVETCSMEPIKVPVKPFLLIKSFPIPAEQRSFLMEQQITIPSDIDPGDYHFMIRLTDKEGWQTIKGLSIKIK
ncbi:protein of unknown function [Pedobacter terrae]|uniref:DUF4625 domain-containing protein n=1 Tax=Pedobacter terrae TaxID=405671 RepID=A0A1G7VN86_9SPHI|nr:DUF4625 domain-containing protein [Pedobacter terrae]SDG61157.1 protein of unknown function [Pedobacter terrae]